MLLESLIRDMDDFIDLVMARKKSASADLSDVRDTFFASAGRDLRPLGGNLEGSGAFWHFVFPTYILLLLVGPALFYLAVVYYLIDGLKLTLIPDYEIGITIAVRVANSGGI